MQTQITVVKLRPFHVPGMCRVEGCSRKTATSRSKWCAFHSQAVRRAQLAINNKIWQQRVVQGLADHRLEYAGKPTKWAKYLGKKESARS